MSKKGWLCLGGFFLFAWLPSCEDKPCQGAEKCECYANDTCDAGLACRSKTCVNLAPASGGASSSGVDTAACLACGEKNCADQAAACKAASGCQDSLSCFLNCGTDPSCAANCATGLTPDSGSKAAAYYSCAITQCLNDCVHVPGVGGAGNPGGGASFVSGGSGNHAGSGSSSAGTGNAGTGGAAVTEPVAGTNWLTLVGNGAPSAQGVNGKLGVNGVFYAYSDDCATMMWSELSRCISGSLCKASETSWGVAIGFDFDNTGTTGTPPNTKHAWNATTHGATGLAWQVRATQRFQVWVQNMDPTFNGTCSATSCDIAGPADGTSKGTMPDGSFSFSTMQKDDWGGTGVAYTFNPANISAMQFKIKAPDLTSDFYELCIDQLGVIR